MMIKIIPGLRAKVSSARMEIPMKRNRLSLVFLAVALAGLSNSPAARADAGNKPAAAEKLSEVDFPISCGAAAQKKFNQPSGFYTPSGTTRRSRPLLPLPRLSPIARWAIGVWR